KFLFFSRRVIWEVIYIKKLTLAQKANKTGGAFYAIALGIGILISTLSNLIMNSISLAQGKTADTNYGFRRTTIMRLSPVPSRSAISIIG
ncbi:MAG: hypothetical protein MJ201_04030, partial [Mycoplasmoidaceae bacterium]|nr:hypothetical protein [Mycoplasmoidaceae bacterium]